MRTHRGEKVACLCVGKKTRCVKTGKLVTKTLEIPDKGPFVMGKESANPPEKRKPDDKTVTQFPKVKKGKRGCTIGVEDLGREGRGIFLVSQAANEFVGGSRAVDEDCGTLWRAMA